MGKRLSARQQDIATGGESEQILAETVHHWPDAEFCPGNW
jgi:hypothetical protein